MDYNAQLITLLSELQADRNILRDQVRSLQTQLEEQAQLEAQSKPAEKSK